MPNYNALRLFLLLMSMLTSTWVVADELEKPEVTSTKLTDSIYLFSGKGGNIGVSIGEDGTFLIDDKYLDMTDAILKAIKDNGGTVPKFVINTHWHGDHTGGNLNLAEQGTIIVAHDNVRKRLSEDKFIEAFRMKAPAQPKAALPVVTFAEEITFHINNDTINVRHLANAHTDGDSAIFFENANLLHTGDLFFNGFYPFVDTKYGGSLKGMALAADKLLTMVNDNTKIIPGHGAIANKKDLQAYRDMLYDAYDALVGLKQQGMDVDQAIKAEPLKALEAQWSKGFISTDQWIRIVYKNIE